MHLLFLVFSIQINLTPACCSVLPQRNSQRRAQTLFPCVLSRLSHRWLKVWRGRWSLLCHPLISIIKLSQPAAHKWGILPAPPSCRDSPQIASDSPPDCAMIMLSLDAVIMMAHNCWCALAAAWRPPISLSTCLCMSIDLLSVYKSFFPLCHHSTLISFFFFTNSDKHTVILVVKHFDVPWSEVVCFFFCIALNVKLDFWMW